MNEFDKINHRYTISGIPVPSVTDLLPDRNYYCTPEQFEAARLEGEENHSLIKMFFDTGMAGKNTMLLALAQWLDENKEIIGNLVLYEKPLFSEKRMFAGKPDAVFSKALIDFKRTFGDKKIHALQLGGYHPLSVFNGIIKKTKTWLVLWFDGEKFKARNVYDPAAEDIFLSLVKKHHIEKGVKQWMNSN